MSSGKPTRQPKGLSMGQIGAAAAIMVLAAALFVFTQLQARAQDPVLVTAELTCHDGVPGFAASSSHGDEQLVDRLLRFDERVSVAASGPHGCFIHWQWLGVPADYVRADTVRSAVPVPPLCEGCARYLGTYGHLNGAGSTYVENGGTAQVNLVPR